VNSSPGAYFVTICTQNREFMFGDISLGEMKLNDAAKMVATIWDELPHNNPGIIIDEFVIMPNHIHGIIVINKHVGARLVCAHDKNNTIEKWADMKPAPTLGDIICAFKSITTNEYIIGVKERGWKSFPGKLWQRNYYEHIIRDEDELNSIREYIVNNPLNWDIDTENPAFCASTNDAK